jgi:hypothetical protein
LTNCVVEVVEYDFDGRCPMLSLRFYYKPIYSGKMAQELADSGHPVVDDETPIGMEITLGPEMAQSLMEQLQAQWPQYLKTVQEQATDED